MKEIEVDTKKWKDIPYFWIGRIILLKCPCYPKQSTGVNNPYQNTQDIFHRTRTNNPKIYMEPQKTLNCPTILRNIKKL